MSGFAILVQQDAAGYTPNSSFMEFQRLVARYKHLALPATSISGAFFEAAKLDSASALHRGITRDENTGSWLLAAGTVVDLTSEKPLDASLNSLLMDYVEHGQDALNRYDGHFALVVFNGKDESISIISDPTGQFSIFFGVQENTIYIASSALAVARHICAKPDTLMLESFLRSGRVYDDKTLWEDVRRLRPATILRIYVNRMEEREYWRPEVDETVASFSFDAALDHGSEILSRLFRRVLQREGKIWGDLTGGFDSRLTTTIMAKIDIPFVAYCAGPTSDPDVTNARKISQEMGWEFQQTALPEDWEELQWQWAETALQKGDAHLEAFQLAGVLWGHEQRTSIAQVHVSGSGADEWREPPCWRTDLRGIGKPSVSLESYMDSQIFWPIPLNVLSRDRTREVRDDVEQYLTRLMSPYSEYPNSLQALLIFVRHRYPTHGGSYLSAASGIVRTISPFCFKESVDFAFSLKYWWKLNYHYRFVRALLERENPRLANMMTTKGGPAIPMRVTNIHKFWPLWKTLLNRNVERFTQSAFGKRRSIWPQVSFSEYPSASWRMGRLRAASSEGLLDPARMHSGKLYKASELQSLVAQAANPGFKHDDFLNRILSLEMALRTVGACVE